MSTCFIPSVTECSTVKDQPSSKILNNSNKVIKAGWHIYVNITSDDGLSVRLSSRGNVGMNFSGFGKKIKTVIQENAFENVLWKMSFILSLLQC